MNSDFINTLQTYRARVESTLAQAIDAANASAFLQKAMRYCTLNSGKRLRPILVYSTGYCFEQTPEALDTVAAAIECMHCYSLIHDDLPAMDDDRLRRGKPTCHIAFGEATAILVGDTLQTLAFDLLSRQKSNTISAHRQLQIIQTVASHAGASGMAAGQSLDLLAEGKKISSTDLEHIHRLKTGALIKASVLIGALGAGCEDSQTLKTLDQFATQVGLAFQLQDDLLDIIGNSKNLGKQTGQDIKQKKATYPILFGVENTQNRVKTLMKDAITLLQSLPQNTQLLQQLCEYLICRDK